MVLLASTAVAAPAKAAVAKAEPAAKADDPQAVAERYLKALADPKQAAGKDYLLGGVTLDAKQAQALGAKIVTKAEPRVEEASLADLSAAVAALDKSGLELLENGAVLAGVSDPKANVDLDQARKMADKTKQLRKDLMTKFPVFADVIRADRMLYWHPKNPARDLIAAGDKTGQYKLEYVAFTVESKDSPKDKPRQWPLRIVRFKSDATSSGWKVLPASSWDPE